MPSQHTWFDLEIAARSTWSAARNRSRMRRNRGGPVDLFLCIVDHFEPHLGRVADAVAHARLEEWLTQYPRIAGSHRDADGRTPAHSFFYPWDEFDPWEMERLAGLCAEGWGEIELHLHHADDTDAGLRAKIREALRAYRGSGALSSWSDGRPAFAFIHGNWALDNSRCENGRNFCGVNNELTVLMEEGCYADFTFPAWPNQAQPRLTNTIYYAVDDPARPKSHDRGTPARAGGVGPPGLLLVQGPLGPRLRRTARGLRPQMEDADLAHSRRYSTERLHGWVRTAIHVEGRPDRLFIKLHTHGCDDRNRPALLGKDLEALFRDAEAFYNDGRRYRLHYVTARQMFNVIKATGAGAPGEPEAARDWLLPPPFASVGQGQVEKRCAL
jgi:hypothetical protein